MTNMEPGKLGIRTYFDVDDINAGIARVKELGGEAGEEAPVAEHGLVLRLQGPAGNDFGLWQTDSEAPTPEG